MIHHFDNDPYINSIEANTDVAARNEVVAELADWARMKVKANCRNGFTYVEVDDVAQDMVTAMLVKWSEFNGSGSRVGWLKMNAGYILLNNLNKRATDRADRTRIVSFVDTPTEELEHGELPSPVTEVDYDVDIYRREIIAAVRDALRNVKVTKRGMQYIELRFWQGLKKPDMARIMGVSKPDAGWVYAKPRLREYLTRFYYV